MRKSAARIPVSVGGIETVLKHEPFKGPEPGWRLRYRRS